jgi:hypothetical protein
MNMKNLIKISTKSLMLLSIATVSWFACKEDEPQLNLSRQFKPAAFTITAGETTAKIAWNPSLFTLPGEVEYVIEVSKDGAEFTNIEFTTTTPDAEVTLADTDIDIQTNYFARVKALGTNGADDSNWLISLPFQITGEILILPIREHDVLVQEAKIRWEIEQVLTKITVTPTGGAPFDVTLSAAEYNAGEKVVSGLTQNTDYKAEVFNSNGTTKGSVTFRTKNGYTGSNVVDLRGKTNRGPNLLNDTLSIIPSGSVVWLKRGMTYNIPAAKALNKSVTIMSGPDYIQDYARIFMNANFTITAASAIDSLVFRDLYMYTDAYLTKYVFNIGNVGTIGKVRFDNVRGHKFRGFFRIQTGTTGTQVGSFLMNNCVVDSLRDFSLVNTNNQNTVANIKVTNTTIFNARKVIDCKTPNINSIVFENCTFNNLVGGGPAGGGTFYFVDLGTFNSANPVTITNCIYGASWNDQGLGNDVRGIQTGATTTQAVTNSYRLSDYISTNATYQLNLTPYAKLSTEVYTSPASGNFKIKDLAFPGANNAGDPRWRP